MKIPTRPRLASSTTGCTAMKYSVSRHSMTSNLVQTLAAALLDSKPDLDGIPFVPPHFSLNFRRWLIWRSIGDGSRDAKLSKATVHPKTETIFRPYSESGANPIMITWCEHSSQLRQAISAITTCLGGAFD